MVMRAEERPSTEERLSRLEGAYPHLATKADVAELRADFRAENAKSEARMIRWLLAVGGLIVAAITLIDRLLG